MIFSMSSGRSEFWFFPSLYSRSALMNSTLFRWLAPFLLMTSTARRDARAVEQPRRKPDDRLQDAVLDEPLAARLFLAATEQDAVRHDDRQLAVALERGDHVLHEHQVRLLAAFRHEGVEPLGELHALRE